MAPTRYLGLPWREWGETDAALTSALHTLDAMACRCGCGQYVDEAHDEALADRWQPRVAICYARRAITQFEDDHKGDIKPGDLVWLELLPEGEQVVDPLKGRVEYDPVKAREAWLEHQRKWGQAT